MGALGWGRLVLDRLSGRDAKPLAAGPLDMGPLNVGALDVRTGRAGPGGGDTMPDIGGIGGLLQAVDVALYLTDAEGRLTFFNDAAAALWGWRPPLRETRWCGAFRLYRPDGTLLPADASPMAVALGEHRARRWGQLGAPRPGQQGAPRPGQQGAPRPGEQGAVGEMEVVLERPDGTLVPVLPHPMPLFDAAGRLAGGVNVLLDITARRAAEAAAGQAAMAKTRFLAAMNHEFRTPLHGILGFADLLAQSAEAAAPARHEAAAWAREIQHAGGHLLGLVNDSIAFAEATLAEARPVASGGRLRLGNLVADALALGAPAFTARGVTLRSEGPVDDPVAAIDPPLARQALLGVMREAARHMPPGGTVSFVWGEGAGTGGPFIALRCPGLALPPALLTDLDRPFAGADRELYARGLDGAGLSVATSAALLRSQGGSLKISGGAAGSPATFRLTFLRAGSALDAALPPVQQARRGEAARRALLERPAPRPSFSLADVVSAARDVIVVTAADLDSPGPTIVYVNPAFVALTGYAAEEVIGRTPRMLQGPGTDRAMMRAMSDALRAGQDARGKVLNYGRDGREYWLDMHIVPLRDDLGRVTHFAAIERVVA